MKINLLNANALRKMPLAVCVFLICSCALAVQEAPDQNYPKKIIDSAGREVTLQMPPERIIVLNSDAAEAITMLGAEDKVVGISDTIQKKGYFFPKLKDKQVVGKWNDPDYEMIGEIARNGDTIAPDIIVISYSYPDKPYGIIGVEKGLSPFGNITSIGLDFYKPENLTEEMEKLGAILGREDEASDYISWYEEKEEEVEKAVEGSPMPKVYVEWSSKSSDLSTMGSGTGFNGMLKIARGYNIARDLSDPYPKVDWEWVVSESPETIIKRQTQSSDREEIGWKEGPSQDTVKLEAAINELLSRAAAKSVPAVKEDQVYAVDWDIMAGLDQIVGLTYLAKILHPGADLDPAAVHREYIQRLGLEYPDDRIFVYPEPG